MAGAFYKLHMRSDLHAVSTWLGNERMGKKRFWPLGFGRKPQV